MRNSFSLIFIIFILFGCVSNPHTDNATYEISFGDDYVDVRDMVYDMEFIELDTVSEALIPNITDMKVYKDRIYCFSNSKPGYVCVFSSDGKFLFKMLHPGHAKNEWVSLSMMFVDEKNDEIILVDNWGCKYLTYTLDGEFIKSVEVPTICNREIAHDGNYYYSITNPYMTNNRITDATDHVVNILNKNGIVNGIIPVKQNSSKVMQDRVNRFYYCENHLLVAPTMDPVVYKIDGEEAVPYVSYTYTGNKLEFYTDDDIKQSIKENHYVGGGQKSFYSGSIVESPDYLIRRLGYNDAVDVLYDKRSGKTVVTKFESGKFGERHLSKIHAYVAPYCYNEGKFFAPLGLSVLGLPESYTNGYVPDYLKPIKEKVDGNSINNVIVAYKIKF